jgi:hypothetical protein
MGISTAYRVGEHLGSIAVALSLWTASVLHRLGQVMAAVTGLLDCGLSLSRSLLSLVGDNEPDELQRLLCWLGLIHGGIAISAPLPILI